DQVYRMATALRHHQAQHQRRSLAGGLAVRPEVDQAALLPGVAQLLQQPHVGTDPDQQVTAAVQQRLPVRVAGEPRVGGHQRPRRRNASMSTRVSVTVQVLSILRKAWYEVAGTPGRIARAATTLRARAKRWVSDPSSDHAQRMATKIRPLGVQVQS